jgi:signal transduction histidine kinase
MTQIRDLDELLSLIVVTIVDNVRVDFAAIYLKEEENGRFTLKSHQPKKPPAALKETFAKDSGIIKALCERKKTHLGEELAYTIHDPELHDSLIIPFLFERELSGVLILGPKPKKYMYTSEDIIVFETLAYAASLAIENCKFWREVEDRQRKARLQEMDAYSYALAHEIDNPVQIILGQADFLKNECSSGILDETKHKEAAESFDFIIEAAERISGMVKAIQDYGQKTSFGQEPLFIEQIVDTFNRLYLPLFKAKGIAFEKSIDQAASQARVLGVKPELVQVFVILANNALHSMRQSNVKKITVSVSTIGTDAARVDFSDTGYGIKEALLPIIFAPFTTTKASSEGTGMGLYNAQKIIARHNGRIWAESKGEGQGARICIELPLLPAQEGHPLQTTEGEDKDGRE